MCFRINAVLYDSIYTISYNLSFYVILYKMQLVYVSPQSLSKPLPLPKPKEFLGEEDEEEYKEEEYDDEDDEYEDEDEEEEEVGVVQLLQLALDLLYCSLFS